MLNPSTEFTLERSEGLNMTMQIVENALSC